MEKLVLSVTLFLALNVSAQDFKYKEDTRRQSMKEDPQNLYLSDRITKIDLIQALELSGITIHKFYLGKFDKKYNIQMILEEYENGRIVDSTIIFNQNNAYYYLPDEMNENEETFMDFIDQYAFYTNENGNNIDITISSYNANARCKIKQKRTRDNQFYQWRNYSKTDWKLNEKIPLLLYASSWYDKEFDFERFCGVVDLSYDEKDTKELMVNSPHCYKISYKVSE